MEPFVTGEVVTLTDAAPAIGHIVGVSDDGATVEVRWTRRPGHDHDVTVEATGTVRRLHESDAI
jgi:uncharacterized protein YodC (DUF2158 family)